jgi:hypothetical protein
MSKGGGGSIPSDYTMKIGGDGGTPVKLDSDLEINSNLAVTKPIVTQSSSDSKANVDLKVEPLDIKIEPLSLDLKVEPLDIKIEPLKVSTDSTAEIDIKPLAVDSCTTIKLAPLPPVRMEQPYSQHYGITFMGIELFGLNISGKSEMFLHSPPKPSHFGMEVGKPHDCREPAPAQKPAVGQRPAGLRVRVQE